MTPILAFMCTGRSTGFDPLCNSTHSIVVLLAVLGALIAVGRAVASRLSTRHPLLRWAAAIVAGGISAWAAGGLLLSFG